MSEEKIEEMALAICKSRGVAYVDNCRKCRQHEDCLYQDIARGAYRAGYRKQSEGHWFILEYEYFTCSECGYYHPNGCDSTHEAKEKLADGKVPKYCSECGAKMKGADNG